MNNGSFFFGGCDTSSNPLPHTAWKRWSKEPCHSIGELINIMISWCNERTSNLLSAIFPTHLAICRDDDALALCKKLKLPLPLSSYHHALAHRRIMVRKCQLFSTCVHYEIKLNRHKCGCGFYISFFFTKEWKWDHHISRHLHDQKERVASGLKEETCSNLTRRRNCCSRTASQVKSSITHNPWPNSYLWFVPFEFATVTLVSNLWLSEFGFSIAQRRDVNSLKNETRLRDININVPNSERSN